MATRACPSCGAQYVASVRRCIDCDVVLVDEAGPTGPDDAAPVVEVASPRPGGEQVAYELSSWGNQLKVTLAGMLEREGIPAAWEAAALVVPAAYEAQVDALIATVEGSDVPELDEDAEQVAFDLDELSADELADLDARLAAEAIAHAWEDGTAALLVAVDDEELVADLIEQVLNPPDDETDGLAAHEALTELYVQVDKLQKDPFDLKLVARLRRAVDALDGLGVPYGMSTDEWRALGEAARTLAELVEAGPDGPADAAAAEGSDLDAEANAADAEEEGDDVEEAEEAEEAEARTPAERARAEAAELRAVLAELV